MEVDVRNLNTYVISVKNATERREKISNVLNQNGFTNWSFVDAIGIKDRSNYWIGCGLSHKHTLDHAVFPCLVLEDDVGITEWFDPYQVLPNNAVTYFGLSSWGLKSGSSQFMGSKFIPFENKLNVIEYMASTHAIYYSDEEVAKSFSKGIINQLFINQRPFDEHYAIMQTKIKTYALKKPLFYQDCTSNKVYTYFTVD